MDATVWVAIKDDGRDICEQLEDIMTTFTIDCSPHNSCRCSSWAFAAAEKIGNTRYMRDILSANTHNVDEELAFTAAEFDWKKEINEASLAFERLYDIVHRYVRDEMSGKDGDSAVHESIYNKYKAIAELVYAGISNIDMFVEVENSELHEAIRACSKYIPNMYDEIVFDDILSLESDEFISNYTNSMLPYNILYDNIWYSADCSRDWKVDFTEVWNKIPKNYSIVILDYCDWTVY